MEIKFDGQQLYQIDAINSVCDLFSSQQSASVGGIFELESEWLFSEYGVANNLQISSDTILSNLQGIQRKNGLPISDALDGMNFSVEMETGTGKTYVYLRTIYELSVRYGFKKFIIVVPSVAIREGVKKTIELTKKHFDELYDNTPCESWVYDSSKVSSVRQFASSNQIQIMIINIDAFNKETNIINLEHEKLLGKKPIEFLRSCNPIVIVDEPQNIESVLAKQAIASLNPLCTLRYSATHRYLYNIVYRLTPVEAYDLRLVKHIEVDSVSDEADFNEPYIHVKAINSTKTKVTASLVLDVKTSSGTTRKSISISKSGIDLYEITGGRDAYRGYIVEEINAGEGYISFANGLELSLGETQGSSKDDIMKAQIRETVREHFEKEMYIKKFLPEGRRLKVLSLFFIDRVANYASDSGKIRTWFVEAYTECSRMKRYQNLEFPDVDSVHGGYFSKKKGKAQDTTGKTKADDETYQLIMRDKERLLSLQEPLRFIFSHSALREGWDNPNVFQICTLNETVSEVKKRQEIGRGLRLPVDEDGNRCFDDKINRLTVIANESYETFAAQLQAEIEEETGICFKGKIKNKRERKPIHLKTNWNRNDTFLRLWERLKQKTSYRVSIDTEKLVALTVERIKSQLTVSTAKVVARKAKLDIEDDGIVSSLQTTREIQIKDQAMVFPDLVGYLQHETGLTRSTITRILIDSQRLKYALINPQDFLDQIAKIIKSTSHELMIKDIIYSLSLGAEYDLEAFADERLSGYLSKMLRVKKSIYDYIEFDSDVERRFAEALDVRDDVKLFIKLPQWYVIETPIGNYNPDWAIVKQISDEDPEVYLVRETKGTVDQFYLRGSEAAKIYCGQKHFTLLDVDYRTAVQANEV